MSERIFGLNLANPNSHSENKPAAARVAIFGLASDFGCQINITNVENSLLDILGMFDLVYWQLASSAPCPEEYDIAIIEGAVTSREHVELLKEIRAKAQVVLTIGACAVTGGIPGLGREHLDDRLREVYGVVPDSIDDPQAPCPVSAIIEVDYAVPGCPIEPLDFVSVLQTALLGSGSSVHFPTLCGSCKLNEKVCFYERGEICLGLVTASGCGAKCVLEDRPCNGCRGIAPDANIEAAYDAVKRHGLDVCEFESKLELFNAASLSENI